MREESVRGVAIRGAEKTLVDRLVVVAVWRGSPAHGREAADPVHHGLGQLTM